MADRPVSPADAHFDDGDPVAEAEASEPTESPSSEAAAPEPAPSPDDVARSASSDADVTQLQDQTAASGEEVQQLRDQLLRQTADFQNYRRRSESDRSEAVRRGRQEALLPLLDVFDDLRRSLDAARRAAEQDVAVPTNDALTDGIELVYKKFEDALAKLGVEPIEAVGRPFSVDEHEAMMQQPAPEDVESGTVLAEIQPGYRLGDRVLRHARVIVAE